MTTKIKNIQVDSPISLNADYKFDKTDRRYIDDQIVGMQQHLVDSILNGSVCTWMTIDGSGTPIKPGMIVQAINDNVTRHPGTGTAAALGVAMTGGNPGTKIRVAISGIVPSIVSALPTNVNGFVRVNSVTSLPEYVSALSAGDISVGTVSTGGTIRLSGGGVGAGGTGPAGPQGFGLPNSAVTTYGAISDGVTSNSTPLTSAGNTLGVNGQMYFSPGTYYFDVDTTLNCSVYPAFGAKFKVAAGKVLTFNGTVYAADYQDLFSGSAGTFVLNANAKLFWTWWGADWTGTVDSFAAIQACTTACTKVTRGGLLTPPSSYGPAGVFYITTPIVMSGPRVQLEGPGTQCTKLTVNNRQHPAIVATQNIGGLTKAPSLISGAVGYSFNGDYDAVANALGYAGGPRDNYLIPSHETSYLQHSTLKTLTKLCVRFFYQISTTTSIDRAICSNAGIRSDGGDTVNVKSGWDISLSANNKLHCVFQVAGGASIVQDHPTVLTPGVRYYVELNWDQATARANFHVAPAGGPVVTISATGTVFNATLLTDIYSMTVIGAGQTSFPDSGAGKATFGKISSLEIRSDSGNGNTIATIPTTNNVFDANTIYGTNFEVAGPNGELVKGYSFGNTDAQATYTPIRLGDKLVGNSYGGGITIRNLTVDNAIYCQLCVHCTVENVFGVGGTYGLWYNNNCYESKISNCSFGTNSSFSLAVCASGVITIQDCELKSSGFAAICASSGAIWTQIYAQSSYVGAMINSASAGATVNLQAFYSTDEAYQTHNATVILAGDCAVTATNCVFEAVGDHGNTFMGVYNPATSYAAGQAVRAIANDTKVYTAIVPVLGVAPTDSTKWALLTDDLFRITSPQVRFTAIGCALNDTDNVGCRFNFQLQGAVPDGHIRVVECSKTGSLGNPNFVAPWHNSTNSKAVQIDRDGTHIGVSGISGSTVPTRNLTGVTTIVGSGVGTSKTGTATFLNTEDDAYYVVTGICCTPNQGTPAAACMGGAYATAKGTTGFTVNLQADPGTGNSVDAVWTIGRYALATQPAITSLGTTAGNTTGGTSVTITGTGFVLGCVVWINGVSVATTFTSSTSLTFSTPSTVTAGDYLVYVRNPDGQPSNFAAFHYNGIPIINSATPTSLTTAGGNVNLTGQSFLAGMTATYNGVNAPVSAITSTTCTLALPATSPQGSYNIILTNSVGASSPFAYSVTDPVGNGTAYGVAGVKHWIKSDIGVTLSGSSVTSVVDQSGLGNTYTAGTATPTLTSGAGGINGKPVFSAVKASSQYLKGPSLSALTASHMFLLVKPTVDATGHSMIGASADNSIDFLPYSSGYAYPGAGTTVRKGPTTALITAAAQVYEIVTTATEYTVYVDGTVVFTTATNAVGFHAGGTFLFGCSDVNTNTAPNNLGTGLIGEWLVFDHKLTSADQTTVRNGIKARWGTP